MVSWRMIVYSKKPSLDDIPPTFPMKKNNNKKNPMLVEFLSCWLYPPAEE